MGGRCKWAERRKNKEKVKRGRKEDRQTYGKGGRLKEIKEEKKEKNRLE